MQITIRVMNSWKLDDYEVIIECSESASLDEINQMRKQRQKKPMQIIQIPFVLADDSKPISSSRIKNKEIDSEGHLLNRD